jgi:hypothetical protein
MIGSSVSKVRSGAGVGSALPDEPEDDMSAHSSVAAQPTLYDTISFMDRSVRPEESYISFDSPEQPSCNIDIVRNKHYLFFGASETYLKSTDALGVEHYGFHYAVMQEWPPVRVFLIPLSSVDPDSIKSYGAVSREFIGRELPDENPGALKNPDLTIVFFNTRNKEKTIKALTDTVYNFGNAPEKSTNVENAPGGTLVFQSKDRAERFVTAFGHAVKLCGGKPSDFAPTPRK